MHPAASRLISALVSALLAVSIALVSLGAAGAGLSVSGVENDDPFFNLVLGAYAITTGAVAWLGGVLSVKVANNPIGSILLGLGLWLAGDDECCPANRGPDGAGSLDQAQSITLRR